MSQSSSIEFSDDTLFLDTETHSITERYDHTPRSYHRLGGYAWGESEQITITESYDELIEVIRSAKTVVTHNGHGFDWSVLFGVDSVEPLEMAFEYKLFDTLTHATLANPAPYKYTPRGGKKPVLADTPEKARKWFSLDNQAYQLGTPGKLMDLSVLAAKYEFDEEPILKKDGTPGKRTKKIRKPGVCCGFGHIPLDDPEFQEYLRDDVRALRHVARALLEIKPMDRYSWDEQLSWAINAQITRNGVRTNPELVQERIYAQHWEAAHILNELNDKFGFPLTGKEPLKSNQGKNAARAALAAVGVSAEGLDRTDTGGDSFGGDSIKRACGYISDGKKLVPGPSTTPERESLAEAIATLAGQRSMPQLTHDETKADGKVHPEIMALQRSGRNSVTKPGLTVFDSKHKDMYIPDTPDERLTEFDYSNADARIVAALSGDVAFAERFKPGKDGHLINALAVWSEEEVMSDIDLYRNKLSKRMGHAWGYCVGPHTLHLNTGIEESICKTFLTGLDNAFTGVKKWQRRVAAQAKRLGYVRNLWGRVMPVEKGREFTQAPALEGQGGTTEILKRAFMKLPIRIIRMIKVPIHDAALFSIPLANYDEDCATIERAMYTVLDPPGGQKIEFPVGRGKPGTTWLEAEH